MIYLSISEYTTDIQHIAGKSNVVAYCLSRAVVGAVVGAVQLGLDYLRDQGGWTRRESN